MVSYMFFSAQTKGRHSDIFKIANDGMTDLEATLI